MSPVRWWVGLFLLVVIIFGALGYAFVALLQGHYAVSLLLIACVWFGGALLARGVGWLVTLGARVDTDG